MSQSVIEHEARTGRGPAEPEAGLSEEDEQSTDPDELLSLLSDEYALEILQLLQEEPLPAREIAEQLSSSRTTVYRRLNSLEEAGLVATSMACHPGGHHRQQFSASLDEVVLSFDGGELTVATAEQSSRGGTEQPSQSPTRG